MPSQNRCGAEGNLPAYFSILGKTSYCRLPITAFIPCSFRDPKRRAGLLIGLSLIHLCNIPVQNDV